MQRLTKLKISKVDLVDKGAAINARVSIFKRRDPIAKEQPIMTLEEACAGLPEDKKAVIMAALAEAAKKTEAPAPQPAEKSEAEKVAEALKALPPALQKRFAAAQEAEAQAKKDAIEREAVAKKEAEELRARVAKMEDESLTREYVAKAQKFPHVPQLNTADLGQVLKRLDRGEALPKDLAAKVAKSFESMNSMIAESALLKAFGNRSIEGGDDPNAQLESIAKGLREKNPELSETQAINKAYDLNPELYAKARGLKA